jgi:hypothetical protein
MARVKSQVRPSSSSSSSSAAAAKRLKHKGLLPPKFALKSEKREEAKGLAPPRKPYKAHGSHKRVIKRRLREAVRSTDPILTKASQKRTVIFKLIQGNEGGDSLHMAQNVPRNVDSVVEDATLTFMRMAHKAMRCKWVYDKKADPQASRKPMVPTGVKLMGRHMMPAIEDYMLLRYPEAFPIFMQNCEKYSPWLLSHIESEEEYWKNRGPTAYHAWMRRTEAEKEKRAFMRAR